MRESGKTFWLPILILLRVSKWGSNTDKNKTEQIKINLIYRIKDDGKRTVCGSFHFLRAFTNCSCHKHRCLLSLGFPEGHHILQPTFNFGPCPKTKAVEACEKYTDMPEKMAVIHGRTGAH